MNYNGLGKVKKIWKLCVSFVKGNKFKYSYKVDPAPSYDQERKRQLFFTSLEFRLILFRIEKILIVQVYLLGRSARLMHSMDCIKY